MSRIKYVFVIFGYYVDKNNYKGHVGRLYKLADIAESGDIDISAKDLCQHFWEKDKVFPDVDYRFFKEKEQINTQ